MHARASSLPQAGAPRYSPPPDPRRAAELVSTFESADSTAAGEITRLLRDWQSTSAGGLEPLMGEVVPELRQMAQMYFRHEPVDHTLQPTALVNEVYLRLRSSKVGELRDRSEFFAFVARLMRQILVDHARSRKAMKRGGGQALLGLDAAADRAIDDGPDAPTILAIDEALDRLDRLDSRQRAMVELRYFVGLSVPEVAEVLGVSRATVERDWTVARHWLAREMSRR